MPDSLEPKKVRILRASCKRMTNHSLLSTYATRWDDDEVDLSAGSTSDFLKCCGCESSTLRVTRWFSEEPGEEATEYYPPRSEDDRVPKKFDNLAWSGLIDSAYRQTLSAFDNGLYTLAGAGVRLILEGVCKDQGIEDGALFDTQGNPKFNKHGDAVRSESLEGKINGLAEKEFILRTQADALHQIRFLGNDAAHDLYRPSKRVVATAIDIVEHLLEQVYEQPEKGKSLAARNRPNAKQVAASASKTAQPPPQSVPLSQSPGPQV